MPQILPLVKRTLLIILSTFCLTLVTAFSQVNENIGPGGNEDKPVITRAPSGQYSLIQKQTDPPLKCCGDARRMNNPCYQTTIHFEDKSKPHKVLPPVALSDQAVYRDAADYTIPPDEQWLVRDAHIFAGWNVLVLYKVEPDGQVREIENHLRDLGLKCVLAHLRRTKKAWANVSLKDFDHVSGEDVSWNSSSDVVHFKVFARPDRLNPKTKTLDMINGWGVDYDLKKHSMRAEEGLTNRSSQPLCIPFTFTKGDRAGWLGAILANSGSE